MIFTITVNNTSATTNSLREAANILFALAGAAKKKEETVESKPRKHKKHLHMKECDVCFGMFKGKKGLGIHKAKEHGLHSPRTAKTLANGNALGIVG